MMNNCTNNFIKRVIGVTRTFKWTITTNGAAVPLVAEDLTLQLVPPRGEAVSLPFDVDDNIVSFTWQGEDQHVIGCYSLILWANFGEENQRRVDIHNFVELIPWSDRQSGEYSDLIEETIELETADFGENIMVVDNLNSTSATDALSANMGRQLNVTKQDVIQDLAAIRSGAAAGAAVKEWAKNDPLITDDGTQVSASKLAFNGNLFEQWVPGIASSIGLKGIAGFLKLADISQWDSAYNDRMLPTVAAVKAKLQAVLTALATIEAVIPSQASSTNKLTDKDYVDGAIATNTANFVGTFDTLAELQAVPNPTKNDYGFVIEQDAQGNEYYDRYKYTGTQWLYEYKVESTPFTTEQWAAIQSGITAALVSKLSALPTNAELNTALASKQPVINDLTTIRSGAAAGATAYQKPAAGIPKTDLTSGVQASLNKADEAAPQATTYTKTEVDAALALKQTSSQIATINGSDITHGGNVTIVAAEGQTITIDAAPTAGSSNAVSSGGVYDAVNGVYPLEIGDFATGYININGGVTSSSINKYASVVIPSGVKQLIFIGNFTITQADACYAFYNVNGVFIAGSAVKYDYGADARSYKTYIVSVPENAGIFKFTLYTEFLQYASVKAVPVSPLADSSVITQSIQNGAVNREKLSEDVFVDSTDRFISFNHHDRSTDVSGYLNQTTGKVGSASTMLTSAFIPISKKGLVVVGTEGAYGSGNGGIIIYNANKQKIRGEVNAGSTINNPYIYNYQEGDAYLRFSYRAVSNPNSAMFGVFDLNPDGTAPVFSQAYTNKFPFKEQTIEHSTVEQAIDKKFVPDLIPAYGMMSAASISVNEENLAASTQLVLDDFPNYIKNNYIISAKLHLSEFANDSFVRLGLINGVIFSIKITSTLVSLERYANGDWRSNKTYTHNLNIASSPFILIELSLNWKGGEMRITTLDGCFVQSWLITEEAAGNTERYGTPFVVASVASTNVKLSAMSPMFRKSIWVIGDSYVSMYNERWTYQMVHTFGIDNFMVDGLAGGTSEDLYSEFVKMMNFSTPKYLVWCLGMNDIYPYMYYNTIKNVEMICRSNGIELILMTIPWPTGGNRKDINDYIKGSGYRYIDGYAAVSSDNNGTWYPGLQENDAHPTVAGARAIVGQVLVDFPEIITHQ